jgi:branched-subunit amino acid aminotransferase/4-amino-4-deoxychorismate lyase
MAYWFNGHRYTDGAFTLSPTDPAFLYGATVFTTLRVYDQTLDHPLTQWMAHRARLQQALADFHWPAPDWHRVRQGAEALKTTYPVLRITCFPDGRELITGRSLPGDLDTIQREGITAWVAQGDRYQRCLPTYKTGNYLGAWLALQGAKAQGAREAILTSPTGQWLETSTGNVWGWANGQWWTPPIQGDLLPGIARQHILHHLQRQGLTVQQQPWTPALIQTFEALAYSNGAVQVVPIHTVLKDQSRLEFDPHHGGLGALRGSFCQS